jgi:uncharacterized protein YgbK (DUF1537 family)
MSSIKVKLEREVQIFPSEISMIADDLAGACDTGIEFLDSVGRVTVAVDSDWTEINNDQREGLVVWNTESRSLSAHEAYDKVRRASRVAGKNKIRILLKKTDSAFRSHFGREIAAVMDELQLELCCLAPAIPAFGRVTRNGIQYIDGLPIAESFYNKDPKHPVTRSCVSEITAMGTRRRIGLLNLETLRSNNSLKQIERLIASGVQIIVADGESRTDLERVVDLFLKRSGRLVFVGGQSLGNALAHYCVPDAEPDTWTKVPRGGVVIVCGTLHPQTRAQLRLSSKTHGLDPVFIQMDASIDCASIEAEAERATVNLTDQIEKFGLGFLASSEDPIHDPDRVEKSLSLAVQKICDRKKLAGLILTGGTTAYGVCRLMEIKRLQLRQRITPGVVLAQAPEVCGMAIGIKGGSLGELDALDKMIDTLRSLV